MFLSIASRFSHKPVCTFPKEIESCGIICKQTYNNDTYILVVKGIYSEKWSLPKGNKYNYETEEECAMRETYEETGIFIRLQDRQFTRVPMGRNVYFITSFDPYEDDYFSKRCLSPSIIPSIEQEINDEVSDIRWMTLSQLRKRKETCNKDLRTLISDKKLWFIQKIFHE